MLEEIKKQFTHEKIADHVQFSDPNFTFGSYNPKNNIFIKFGYIGDDSSKVPPEGVAKSPGGWKLHIALMIKTKNMLQQRGMRSKIS